LCIASGELYHYSLDDSNWIVRTESGGTSRRVCWLPVERAIRGEIAHRKDQVCIGTYNGAITILDFSAVQLPPLSM
jgi:hypothetical protein